MNPIHIYLMKTYKYLATLASLAIFASSAQAALVGHYEFEETSGTTFADSSGNNFDGNLISDDGTGTLDVPGQIGSAYKPGGGGQEIYLGELKPRTTDKSLTA